VNISNGLPAGAEANLAIDEAPVWVKLIGGEIE